MILFIDRIFHIEDGRNRHRDFFAILNRHRAVVAFGHNLHRRAVLVQHPDADKPKADADENGFDDIGKTLVEPGFGNQPRLKFVVCVCHVRQAVRSSQFHAV